MNANAFTPFLHPSVLDPYKEVCYHDEKDYFGDVNRVGRIKGIVNGEVTQLYWREGRWYWKVTGNPGIFFTGIGGDGIFYDAESETQQIAGSIEFSSCETESGMLRKLARYFAQFS